MPRCPKCTSPMARVENEGINMHTCGGCFGTWIGNIQLIRLTRQQIPDAAAQQPLGELAALVSESNSKQILRCPSCSTNMAKVRFHPMVPLDLDQCQKCKNYWLDAGELNLLRRLYFEMTNSTDPNIIALREKVAQAGLEWEMRRESIQDSIENASKQRRAAQNATSFTLDGIIRMLRP